MPSTRKRLSGNGGVEGRELTADTFGPVDTPLLRETSPVTSLAEVGLAEAEPTGAGLAGAGLVEAEPVEAGLAEAGLAEAGSAEARLAEAGLAKAGSTEAGSTEARLAEAGSAEAGLTEIEPTEAGLLVALLAVLVGVADTRCDFHPRKRKALVTTHTELTLIAAAAIIGFRLKPAQANAPAATGMQMAL